METLEKKAEIMDEKELPKKIHIPVNRGLHLRAFLAYMKNGGFPTYMMAGCKLIEKTAEYKELEKKEQPGLAGSG